MRVLTLRALALSILIVAAVLLPVAWHKEIRHRFLPRNFGMVDEGVLYRSGYLYPGVLRRVCRKHNIRTIVDLGDGDAQEDTVARELGITRYAFNLPGDGRGDPNKWAGVLALLADPEAQPVLVHCAAGAQRTSTAVLLFRKYVGQTSFQGAYPESFEFKHKSDEWELLAYLADHAERIHRMWRDGAVELNGDEISLDEFILHHRCVPDMPSQLKPVPNDAPSP